MFEHTECSENKNGKIEIKECSPEAVKAFLEMLLSGRPSKGSISDVALSTFVLADKYNIKSLKDFCVPYIIKDLDEKSCLETLVTSYLHDNDAVTDAALEVLRANKSSLMKSEEWRGIIADYPKLVSQLLFKIL